MHAIKIQQEYLLISWLQHFLVLLKLEMHLYSSCTNLNENWYHYVQSQIVFKQHFYDERNSILKDCYIKFGLS